MENVHCFDCADKSPGVIRTADFLVFVRKEPYQLNENAEIDNRLLGVCRDCLSGKNDFQRKNTKNVDPNHKDLIYKHKRTGVR